MNQNAVSRDSEHHSDMQEQLTAAKQEAAENYDKYLRALAESENMRKRLQRLCDDRVWQEKKRLLTHLLELADQLEEALKYAKREDSVASGVRITHEELQSILNQEGVEPLQSVGEAFDPNVHEAIELTDDGTKGRNEVTHEYRKGYVVAGKLLRAARVEVNKSD
jgi:molecular chaperone GrpE